MALRGTLTHRKTRRLARLLNIPAPCALGVMEALWHVTAEQMPDGGIGRMGNADIAEEMFWTGEVSADALIAALAEAQLLDPHPEFRYLVHDWPAHADDAVHMALARKGKTFATGEKPRMSRLSQTERAKAEEAYKRTDAHEKRTDAPAARTECEVVRGRAHICAPPEPCHAPPEPEPEPLPSRTPETEHEIPSCPPEGECVQEASVRVRVESREWETHWTQFIAVYPKRDGGLEMPRGRDVFKALIRKGADPALILDGVRRYRAWADASDSTGTRFVKQIPSWLNGRLWEEPWDPPPASMRGAPHLRRQSQQHSPDEVNSWLREAGLNV